VDHRDLDDGRHGVDQRRRRLPPRIAGRALKLLARRAGVDFARHRLAVPAGTDFDVAAEALFPRVIGHWQVLERPVATQFTAE
jgi:hypothetical protein